MTTENLKALLIVSFLCMITGPIISIFISREYKKQQRCKEHTFGTVIAIMLSKKTDKYIMIVQYTVNGVTYQKEVYQMWKQPIGTTLPIWYEEANPSNACVSEAMKEPFIAKVLNASPLIGLVLLFTGIIIFSLS